MNPEQQRMAIAEACGWTWHGDDSWPKNPHNFYWKNGRLNYQILPDFLNDLNAMHEAEMILTKLQRMIYVNILWEKCSIAKADPYDWSVSSKPTLRAEAFLHTIGKWEEAK